MGCAKHTKGCNSPLNDDLLQYNAVVCMHTLCQIIIMKPYDAQKEMKKKQVFTLFQKHMLSFAAIGIHKSMCDNTVPNTEPKQFIKEEDV